MNPESTASRGSLRPKLREESRLQLPLWLFSPRQANSISSLIPLISERISSAHQVPADRASTLHIRQYVLPISPPESWSSARRKDPSSRISTGQWRSSGQDSITWSTRSILTALQQSARLWFRLVTVLLRSVPTITLRGV